MSLTNRQNQVMNGITEYTKVHGIATFNGQRVNIDQFVDWAQARLGIRGSDIISTVKSLLKEGRVKQSVRGNNEIIVKKRHGG